MTENESSAVSDFLLKKKEAVKSEGATPIHVPFGTKWTGKKFEAPERTSGSKLTTPEDQSMVEIEVEFYDVLYTKHIN